MRLRLYANPDYAANVFWEHMNLDLRIREDRTTRRPGPELDGLFSLRYAAVCLVTEGEVEGDADSMNALWDWCSEIIGFRREPGGVECALLMEEA